jgi:hypothetical protein
VNTRDQNPFAGPSRQRPNNDAAVNNKALSRRKKDGSMLNNNQLIALIAQLEIEADAEREDSGDYESMTRTCVTLREIIPTQPVRSHGIAKALY